MRSSDTRIPAGRVNFVSKPKIGGEQYERRITNSAGATPRLFLTKSFKSHWSQNREIELKQRQMKIKLQIDTKAGKLSVPDMDWQLEFTDKYAGFVMLFKMCEEGLLTTLESSRLLRALERSSVPNDGVGESRSIKTVR